MKHDASDIEPLARDLERFADLLEDGPFAWLPMGHPDILAAISRRMTFVDQREALRLHGAIYACPRRRRGAEHNARPLNGHRIGMATPTDPSSCPTTPRTDLRPPKPDWWEPQPSVSVEHRSIFRPWSAEVVAYASCLVVMGFGAVWAVSYLICETFLCSPCGCPVTGP